MHTSNYCASMCRAGQKYIQARYPSLPVRLCVLSKRREEHLCVNLLVLFASYVLQVLSPFIYKHEERPHKRDYSVLTLKLRQLRVLRVPRNSKCEAEGHKQMREGTHLCTCRHTPGCASAAQACKDKPRLRECPPFIPRGALPASPPDGYSPSPRRCRWGRRSAAGPGSARCSWPRSHRSRWGCRGRRRARSDGRR